MDLDTKFAAIKKLLLRIREVQLEIGELNKRKRMLTKRVKGGNSRSAGLL
jgi:hypothetical protein